MSKTRVLVVEDEIVVSEDLQQRLSRLGYEVVGAADTAADAIQQATAARPDVALMDIMLHGRPEGIDAAEHLKRQLDIPVIYLTAHTDSATLQKAKLTDPSGYIVKPFEERQLQAAIELAPHRHAMERKVRLVAHWLKATLTSIGDAIIVTNINAEVLLLNPAAEALTGWKMSEAVGKPFHEVLRLVAAKTREPVEDPAICALRYGELIRLAPDTLLIRRDGQERHVNDSAAPIIDETGNTLGAVVVLTDATDIAAARKGLEDLTHQLNELTAEKQASESLSGEFEVFAAGMSHDLRAPLMAIAGYSDLLTRSHSERIDATGRRFLERIHANAEQMNKMVDDYLHFMRMAYQRQPLQLDLVNMKSLAETVFAEFASLPGQKPARLVCDAMPHAHADAAMVPQVLANLIGNALKYSSKHEQPVVEVGAMAAIAGEDFHTYFVRDNGVGLDLTLAAKLFEPFQRFHGIDEFSGTGVGLAIVKRILERHDGRIWAQSEPGAGATFLFTLPAGHRPPREPKPA